MGHKHMDIMTCRLNMVNIAGPQPLTLPNNDSPGICHIWIEKVLTNYMPVLIQQRLVQRRETLPTGIV